MVGPGRCQHRLSSSTVWWFEDMHCMGGVQELMEAAPSAGANRQRRLPRGTSDYQAAWILDEDGDEDDYEPLSDVGTSALHESGGLALEEPSEMGCGTMADDDDDGDNFGSEVGALKQTS